MAKFHMGGQPAQPSYMARGAVEVFVDSSNDCHTNHGRKREGEGERSLSQITTALDFSISSKSR
jgi:hypothetical protein